MFKLFSCQVISNKSHDDFILPGWKTDVSMMNTLSQCWIALSKLQTIRYYFPEVHCFYICEGYAILDFRSLQGKGKCSHLAL